MKLVSFTEAERAKLSELQAKQAAAEESWRDLMRTVRAHKADVLRELHAVADAEALRAAGAEAQATRDSVERVAKAYGCSVADLLDYIGSDRQVDYYRKTHAAGTLNLWDAEK